VSGGFSGTLVLGVLALLVTLAAVALRRSGSPVVRRSLRWASAALWALAAVVLVVASTVIVSTKNVGVVTSFGRPVANLSNGFHVIAPWDRVTEMDAAIQTDGHVRSGDAGGCISVRIAHQAVACADTSIRWRIREDQAATLFQDYRDFSNVGDSLVTRELSSTMNGVFESYDPLAIDEAGTSTAPSLNALSQQVTTQMQAQVGRQVDVLNVMVSVVHFDADTQSRINALQAQVAQTRIAQQAEQTANAQAAANAALAASVSQDPNVLVSRCFDLLNEMVNKQQAVPAGFSCWPGGGSSVLVPSAAAAQPAGK
jgi:regulator of protease activity HflC (stomatin/prohibitin superfamily)